MSFRSLVKVAVFFTPYFISLNALALNVQSFKPELRRGQGVSLNTSSSLQAQEYTAGTMLNWVHNPLETGTPTSRSQGIVDDFVTMNLLAGYGITDWLGVQVDVPVNLFRNIGPVFIPTRDKGGLDMGDIRLTVPVTPWNADETENGWGLALIPFVTFPTGEFSTYFGDRTLTGGLNAVGDKLIGKNRLYANVGARLREDETISNLTVNHELTFGVGFQRPIVEKWNLDAVAEVSGSTTFDDFFNQDTDVPVEAFVALRKSCLEDRLSWTLGAGKGITSGYSAPDVRVFAGLSYTGKFNPSARPRPAAKQDEPQVILFDFDKSKVKPVYEGALNGIAERWRKNPDLLIRVAGHADSKGPNSYNDKLSLRRAKSVQKELLKRGVKQGSVELSSFGENKPVAANTDASGRQRNRRVEILWLIVK